MSEPTTLGELLAWAPTDLLRRILYGTDEPCPECHNSTMYALNLAGEWRYQPCATCPETGRIKTPGLVERALEGVLRVGEEEGHPNLDATTLRIVRTVLRREIGEGTG
jgi:hypothetical protein